VSLAGSVGLLAACGPIQPKLATDPNTLAPPSAAKLWAPEEATRVPGGKATMESFAARSPPVQPAIRSGRVYDLPDLIDLAQQTNPETRAAWQATRAAAARLGIAEGAYLPTLSAIGMASYAHLPDYDKMGPFLVRTGVLEPLLRLDWLLLDFGRRTADLDSAAQTLLAANLQFNRKQQSVIFAVQKAYFAFDASRARITARETALKAATAVEEATGIRQPQRSRLDHRYSARTPGGIAAAIRHSECAPRRSRRRGATCPGDRDLPCFAAAGCIALFPADAGGTSRIRGFTASAGRFHPQGPGCQIR
jgi:Outer membrane efflux protein